MKHYILFIFLFIGILSQAQVWVEGFAVHSSPSKDFLASGSEVFRVTGHDPINIPNKELFMTLAEPSYGGGLNLRYAKNNLIVGMEMSFVGYQPATDLLRADLFRIGPIAEYYFNGADKKLQPYLGGEIGLNMIKAHYNGELFDTPEFSNTHLGIGPRAGVVWMLDPKWALRLGVKYIYAEQVPYFDISAGIAVNLGDF